MMYNDPDVLDALLSFLADQIAEYIVYQVGGVVILTVLWEFIGDMCFDQWGFASFQFVGLHAE